MAMQMTGHFLVRWLGNEHSAAGRPICLQCSSPPAARWNRHLTFERMKGNAPNTAGRLTGRQPRERTPTRTGRRVEEGALDERAGRGFAAGSVPHCRNRCLSCLPSACEGQPSRGAFPGAFSLSPRPHLLRQPLPSLLSHGPLQAPIQLPCDARHPPSPLCCGG